MAKTKIADIVNPQVIQALALERLAVNSAFLGTSAVQEVDSDIDKGGTHLTMTYIKEDETSMEALTETTSLTPVALGEQAELGVVCRRGQAVGNGDIAKLVALRDLNSDLATRFADKSAKAIDTSFVNVVVGATPAANTSTVGTNTGTKVNFSASAVITAEGLLGDQQDDLDLIVMHSKVYNDARQADLIDFQMPSEGTKRIAFYGTKRVIVSDRLPVDISETNDLFATYIVRNGALLFDTQEELNVEFDRDILEGGGTDYIAGTVHYVCHLAGMGFDSAIVLPTDEQLADSGNWTLKKYSAKSIGCVKLITNSSFANT